jgi:hypothetical protein
VRLTLESVTTLRIAHAEPAFISNLVVLADDAGRRAVPVWWRGYGVFYLSRLLERAGEPAEEVITADVPQELTTRLLGAARTQVTGVDIDVTVPDTSELSPDVAVARIGLAGPAGTRQVTADLGLGLALAAAAGAPVRLPENVLDRLAVPVPGDDLLTPFLERVPPGIPGLSGYRPRWPLATLRGPRPRYEPRNMDFASGLDRWDLDSWPGPRPVGPRPGHPGAADDKPDYAAAAEGPSAVLSSVAERPAGSAALVQAIYAEDYRGATVTFSGEIRIDALAGQTGLRLEVLWHWRAVREDHGLTIAGRPGVWHGYEITARIPADANIIRFGIGLTGPGRVALRNPDLRIAEPAPGTP